MTWSQVRGLGLILAAGWILLPITETLGKEWHARYERLAKDNLAATRPTPEEALGGIRWATYLASEAEREALRDLAAAPIDDRLKALEAMLSAAESGDNPPLEFAVHAITSDNEKVRQRVLDEVLVPRYRRLQPGGAAGVPLFRVFIALEATNVEPGLTVAILKDLIRQPVSQKESATQLRRYELLVSTATRAPQAEREAVFTMLVSESGREFMLPIYRRNLPDRLGASWESVIQSFTRSVVEPRAVETQLRPLAKMLADGADDRTLLAGLADFNFHLELLPKPRREMCAKLAAAALRSPPTTWSANRLADLELTADERFALANALKLHPSARVAETACDAILRKTPPEHAFDIARRFPELGSEPKRLVPLATHELFKNVPEEQARALVAEWAPQLPEKVFLAGPVLQLAEKLTADARAKLHQKLLADCLAKMRRDVSLGPHVLESLILSADVKPEVVAELITSEYGDDVTLLLKTPRSGTGKLLGRALSKVTPDFRAQCFLQLLAAVQAERTKQLPSEIHAAFIELAPILTAEQRTAAIPTLAAAIVKDRGPSFETVWMLLQPLPAAERVKWVKSLAEHAAPNADRLHSAGSFIDERNVHHSRRITDYIPRESQLEVCEHFLTRLEVNAIPDDWRLRISHHLLRTMDLAEDPQLSQVLRKWLERDPNSVITGTWLTIAPYHRLDVDVVDRMAVRMTQKLFVDRTQTAEESNRMITAVSESLHRLLPAGRDEVWEQAFLAIDRRIAWPAADMAAEKVKRTTCRSLLSLFRDGKAALPAAQVERLTTLALLLAEEADQTDSNNYASLTHLRGEFGPGFAPRKIIELIDGKPGVAVTPESLARRGRELVWFASHAPPQDNEACFKLLTNLLRDELARDEKFPKRTLSASIAECLRRKSSADAAPWVEQILEEFKAAPRDWFATRAAGAVLQPLARQNPAAVVEKLKETRNAHVDYFIAEAIKEANRALFYQAVLEQARLNAAVKNPQPYDTFLFRQVTRLTPAEKLACLEKFADGPCLDPKLVQHFTEFNGVDLFRDEDLPTLTARLKEPDCVGLRRRITEISVQRLEAEAKQRM